LLSSEKRSLFRFLAIYLTSTFLLFSLASWIFYISTKHNLLDHQLESIKYESQHIKTALRILQQSNEDKLVYPQSDIVNSAIYDLDKRYIFGTFNIAPKLEGHRDSSKLYQVSKIEPYYLGAAYLLVSKEIDFDPIKMLQKNIFLFMLGAGMFFTILGYFLGKLFIAPMRKSIENMNHFIQDTTHEMNTPISTILTNIEMIEALGNNQNSEELKRIEIASKTLSRIYDDLTYLNLNHKYHRDITTVNISKLIHERMLYFSAMAEAKELKLVKDIHDNVILQIDKNDALRLIDNLISNAIKYNYRKGKLTIKLDNNRFLVEDTGIGIKEQDMGTILHRFKRANKSEGGFGIGLDIVNQVVNYYAFILNITSQVNKGTEVEVRWKK
jgi:two-component system OmpR family sensor kinase